MSIVAEPSSKRPRQGELVITCPQCGGRCKAGSSAPRVTYYYCSRGCNYSLKVTRPG